MKMETIVLNKEYGFLQKVTCKQKIKDKTVVQKSVR